MLEISQLDKRYGNQRVIGIDHLSLPKGIYWIKGENGSGKSTLLSCIAGMIPYKGAITVAGITIHSSRNNYINKVNLAVAEPEYPDFLTGSELIQFYQETKKGNSQQVCSVITDFGIDNFKNRKIATYSSGMYKKLSLAVAFSGQPELILLDEPLITLDSEAVSVLSNNILSSYHSGTSFIITSHQPLPATLPIATTYTIANKTIIKL